MKADVIIVLGAAVWPNEQPSPSLIRRVKKAVGLYEAQCAKIIVMSGGVGRNPPAEAVVMKNLAVTLGVPSDNIIIESQSINTFQSVINCLNLMDNHKWSDAIIVSDSYHLLRSVFLFKALGKKAEGKAPDEGRGDTKLWKWVFYHFRELAALPWYILKLIFYKYSATNSLTKKSSCQVKPRTLEPTERS